MRELFRSLLSANLFVTGVILFLTSILVFYGTVYLLNYTNLGKKLAFLVTGAGTAAWMTIGSLLFVLYAPRGPRPVNIEGLNAFEVRIIPITFMVVSAVVFIGFLVALHQYEEAREKADL
ncbi:MAG: sugar transferase [bacterium]|nr:sugar transferase [bacterium]MDE0132124.1 sugar transferase [bacterium]MDE0187744.1 sugar transferase [bacterium]MDE0234698.1 sugar transferase [bacterium]MDE0500169.1 sugar transferase [bacterium]